MNRGLLLLAMISALASASGQAPPDTISRSPNQPITAIATNYSQTNALALGDLSVTNSAGTVYSADQLAAKLQAVRTAVDQALPVLTTFNDNFSNSSSGLSGKVSELLSGVLNRGTNKTPSTQSSPALSNVVSGLERLLTTNNPTGAASVNVNTTRGLMALQSQLQEVQGTLRSLNVGPAPGIAPATTNSPLTPTGR